MCPSSILRRCVLGKDTKRNFLKVVCVVVKTSTGSNQLYNGIGRRKNNGPGTAGIFESGAGNTNVVDFILNA